MAITYLGNIAVLEPQPEVDPVPRPDLGSQITTYVTAESNKLSTSFVEIESTWHLHSSEAPSWVESDNTALASLLADHFDCPVGRPDEWVDGVAATEQEE